MTAVQAEDEVRVRVRSGRAGWTAGQLSAFLLLFPGALSIACLCRAQCTYHLHAAFTECCCTCATNLPDLFDLQARRTRSLELTREGFYELLSVMEP